MKIRFKVFHTASEFEVLEAEGQIIDGRRVLGGEVILVTDEQKALIDKVRAKIDEVCRQAASSGNEKEDKAHSLASSVRSAMDAVQKYKPNCRPASAGDFLYDKTFFDQMHAYSLWEFFDCCVHAVIGKDADFFDALADAAKDVAIGRDLPPLIVHAQNAYCELQQAGTIIPTKKQVRELALRQHAIDNLKGRPKYKNIDWHDEANFSKNLEDEIRLEAEHISGIQNWSRFWEDAGLKDLPNDPGGRPAHKRHTRRS